jgi:hypothetical protein
MRFRISQCIVCLSICHRTRVSELRPRRCQEVGDCGYSTRCWALIVSVIACNRLALRKVGGGSETSEASSGRSALLPRH